MEWWHWLIAVIAFIKISDLIDKRHQDKMALLYEIRNLLKKDNNIDYLVSPLPWGVSLLLAFLLDTL